MAKTIFLVFLLLDFLMLGWSLLTSGRHENASREPQRMATQLFPEKIRLVNQSSAVSEQCYAYTAATIAEAQEAAKAVSGALPAARVAVRQPDSNSKYEVVLPGYTRRVSSELKVAELKQLGFGDGVDVRKEGDRQYSIFVASSPDRNGAEVVIRNLASKGIRAAVINGPAVLSERSMIEVRGEAKTLSLLLPMLPSIKTLQAATCASPTKARS